ncbi:SCP2 sterol-binding domain-containing protein [archaeon]|nr:MAG: SCP2 sterol-binding domain-containing protein [archaeon]
MHSTVVFALILTWERYVFSRRQEVVSKIKAVVLIRILDDTYKHAYRHYLLSFHPTLPVAIASLSHAPSNADTPIPPACVLNANDKTFTALLKGDLSPEFAYMSGKLKIDGHMGVALKIKNLLDIAKGL